MIHLSEVLALVLVALPLVSGCVGLAVHRARASDILNRSSALVCALSGLGFAAIAIHQPRPVETGPLIVDAAGGVFIAAIAVIGLFSALTSPSFLDSGHGSLFPPSHSRRLYYLAFNCFWAALFAVPLAANLGLAWLLIEATTSASALLVAFSGEASALEAGWKYLMLTTIGLTFALLGILILLMGANDASIGVLGWHTLADVAPHIGHGTLLTAFLFVVIGLATKIGWAPVHNWLPDAHSEAPPPASALLSAALLPSVVLVAWRVKVALGPAIGVHNAAHAFIGFGLLSLAVAVPFLWHPLVFKRLLAYSSLEHMGVIALGIGFGTRLALAGVVIHVLGHALAKSLGFYVSTPLFRAMPGARRRPARGIAFSSRGLAAAFGISLGSLSGLPPSPLFFSEVFILVGGFLSGQVAAATIATLLLALGFLGLVHALVEGLSGSSSGRRRDFRLDRGFVALCTGTAVLLVGLSAVAFVLPRAGLSAALWSWSR